jgi:hypothetical protein
VRPSPLPLALLAAVALAAGCGNAEERENPTGRWSVDVERTVEGMREEYEKKIAEMPEDQRERARAEIPKALEKIRRPLATDIRVELDLRADRTFTGQIDMPDHQDVQGNWKEEGAEVVLRVRTRNGVPQSRDQPPLRFERRGKNLWFPNDRLSSGMFLARRPTTP